MIGRVGNINNIDGLQIYLFDNAKIGEIYLINFELSLEVHKKNYTLLQSIDNPFLNNNNSLFLYGLKIKEEFRGLGHSKTLIEESIKELIKYKLEYSFLICKTDNKISQNLYFKYGFVKYITDGEDDLLYMKNPHF
jgi:ribosomal protein S18 acetylase RimI-like enzyme